MVGFTFDNCLLVCMISVVWWVVAGRIETVFDYNCVLAWAIAVFMFVPHLIILRYPSVSLRGRLLKDNRCFCAGVFTGLECGVVSEKYMGYTIYSVDNLCCTLDYTGVLVGA